MFYAIHHQRLDNITFNCRNAQHHLVAHGHLDCTSTFKWIVLISSHESENLEVLKGFNSQIVFSDRATTEFIKMDVAESNIAA